VIVGAEPRKLVTIARSLHRHGVRCLVAAPSGQPLRISSRAIAGSVQLEGGVNESAGQLCRFALAERASWVVPTSDSSLQIVCAAYDELTTICAVGSPPPRIVQRILDKAVTLATAAGCGVPVPASVAIESARDLDAALEQLRFPIVAKPGDKSRRTSHQFKTRTFTSAAELRAIFGAEPRFGEGLLFQTYHRGQGVGIEVLVSKGELLASFQHRRLSETPPSGGVAVVAVAEPVDPVLLDHSLRLLRALEWEGVAMVEFRHDRATGESALMEVNGRFWGSLPLAVAAGVDFPLYAWQLSQGVVPIPPSSYRYGLRVRWSAGSLMRAAHIFAEDREDRLSLASAARQLLADFAPGTRSAMWSWSDPAPAFQEVGRVLGRWGKDAVKETLRTVLPNALVDTAKASLSLPPGRRARYVRRRLLRIAGAERASKLPRPIRSVLFVCHGNIMRSAAAAEFLRAELDAAGVHDIRIGSAGTNARDGRLADARAQEAARLLGVSLHTHRAARLTPQMVADYDVIFAMDELNFVNVLTTFPESRRKLMLFGGMDMSGSYRPHEIADPYLAAGSEVTATIETIRRYVAALAGAISRQRGGGAATAPSAAAPQHDVGR
jgi:protein-tyrosine-phosphatase/predicted ATP-grasp superfamily ATP-dependent carboligase